MNTLNAVPITALYAGLNALIMLALAGLAVRARGKYSVDLGHGDSAEMERAVRAHGNNVEYVPFALLLLLLLELMGAWAWILHLYGATLTVARIAHGYGLSKSSGESPGRFFGTLFTWVAIFAGALGCIFMAI